MCTTCHSKTALQRGALQQYVRAECKFSADVLDELASGSSSAPARVSAKFASMLSEPPSVDCILAAALTLAKANNNSNNSDIEPPLPQPFGHVARAALSTVIGDMQKAADWARARIDANVQDRKSTTLLGIGGTARKSKNGRIAAMQETLGTKSALGRAMSALNRRAQTRPVESGVTMELPPIPLHQWMGSHKKWLEGQRDDLRSAMAGATDMPGSTALARAAEQLSHLDRCIDYLEKGIAQMGGGGGGGCFACPEGGGGEGEIEVGEVEVGLEE